MRTFWQFVVCSESGLEFLLLLPTIVAYPEISTLSFLCIAEVAAQLLTLPSAPKNNPFVFMSIKSS